MAGTFLRVRTLRNWDRFLRYQEIGGSDFVTVGIARAIVSTHFPILGRMVLESNFKTTDVVHFISHRWNSLSHPDPDGQQLEQIKAEFPDDALIWYDYSCLPQEPRTESEESAFLETIEGIPSLIRQSWFVVVGTNIESYATRSWCQFEAVCAQHYGSYPEVTRMAGEDRSMNTLTEWSIKQSPLYQELLRCMSALPRLKPFEAYPAPEQHAEYLQGFLIDVPDLNDPVFSSFKSAFFQLQASKLADPPRLWEVLRTLFPIRRDDYTWAKY
jgi:hypothetical protein